MRNVKIARPRDLRRADRPWSDAETAAVPEAASGGLRLALALACYAGMRGGDIARVTIIPQFREPSRQPGGERALDRTARRPSGLTWKIRQSM